MKSNSRNIQIGSKFSLLTVIKLDIERTNKKHKPFFRCLCDCGNETIVEGYKLLSNETKSCGCLRSKKSDSIKTYDEYINKKINHLTILEHSKCINGKRYFKCQCDCGKIYDVSISNIITNRVKSCGCIKPDRSAQIVGEKFGRLLVLEKIKSPNEDDTSAYFKCQCDCGNLTTVQSNRLRSGKTKSCGCARIKNDLTGKRFGKLTALQPILGNGTWSCQCDCGKIKEIKTIRLLEGDCKSCGSETCNDTGIKNDLTGKRFGKLTALKIDKIENSISFWLCQCDCGKTVSIRRSCLRDGSTFSCGCFNRSKGEFLIEEYLVKNNIEFVSQKTFDDLIDPDTKYKLRYDFQIIIDNHPLLIEFDGIQHEKIIKFFNTEKVSAEEKFKKQLFHDTLKNNFSNEHNIPLLRIKYTNIKNISTILDSFINEQRKNLL